MNGKHSKRYIIRHFQKLAWFVHVNIVSIK